MILQSSERRHTEPPISNFVVVRPANTRAMSAPLARKGRIAVLAFGTLGDVLPVAVVVVGLAKSKRNHVITFITHSAHEFLKGPLASAGVSFHPISTPPVALPPENVTQDYSHLQSSEIGGPRAISPEGYWKVHLEQQHREECLLAVEQIFGLQLSGYHDFIIFNFFALEGWHLAELFCVPCAVAAPYVVPYSAPGSFEREFHAMRPLLYERLQQSHPGEVGWGEVMHWMWPLFTDRWTGWRLHSLHLSACPLTDPVTELPILQDWPRAPLLLYGFSQEVVECPAYWPRSIHICGFWYAPPEWEPMYGQTESAGISNTIDDHAKNLEAESPSAPLDCNDAGASQTIEDHSKNSAAETPSAPLQCKLLDFLAQSTELDDLPIFLGLSSIGSMGYLRNPENFLKLVLAVVEAANRRALLFTASYLPLDSVVVAAASNRKPLTRNMKTKYSSVEDFRVLKDGIILGNNRLFCFSGFVSYNWLFPKCSMVIHHGGSGTTAAALRSGVPQIICPFVLDQFYWAERMAWIGVAPQPLKSNHLFPAGSDDEFLESVSTVVNTVADASSSVMRDTVAALSQKLHQEDGVGKFVQILSEQLLKNEVPNGI